MTPEFPRAPVNEAREMVTPSDCRPASLGTGSSAVTTAC